jgi:hypothetical protein
MAKVRAQTARVIAASPDEVYATLADYESGHRKILTGNYTNYSVEQGGRGAGTVITFHFAAGGRERDYRMEVDEPAERTLRERDVNSSLETTWTVTPATEGSRVVVATEWEGSSGIGGFFERTFAPMSLKRIYAQMLENLEAAAKGG